MKSFTFLLLTCATIASCNQPDSARNSTPKPRDSAEVVNLLKNVYQWHDKMQTGMSDLFINVKDSFQVGVNYDSLDRTLAILKQTNYFSAVFLNNYRQLADRVDKKLKAAQPKMLNEINFDFQDADPWTGWQDSDSAYWDKFEITNYRAKADSVMFQWRVLAFGSLSEPYAVRFSKREGKWKVDFLQGFDAARY